MMDILTSMFEEMTIAWLALLFAGVFAVEMANLGATVFVFRRAARNQKTAGYACSIEQGNRMLGISQRDAGHRVEQVEAALDTVQRAQHSLEIRASGGSN